MERIAIIAALGAKTLALGKDGKLLWHLPDDMKRFKELTTGHPVIMGLKTWESLPERFRPLSGRTNIVMSLHDYHAGGATVARSIESAKEVAASAPGANEIFIIGGGEIYRQFLPFANRLYLTLVDDTTDADTFFPPYEQDFKIISNEAGTGEPPHRFLTFERK
ncbi:dihydrofolate reductase [bacterium]|nr:MAG: dihydrofolate reductase [bacterium]